MKLNLVWNTGIECGADYLNINPFTITETNNIKRGDVKNLDNWVDSGEATELIVIDVIDYLDKKDVVPVIQHWITKLAHGGKIIIGGVDLYEASRAFTRYNIDIIKMNELVHGSDDKLYMLKKTNFTILGLCDLLKTCGLKIIKRNLEDNYRFVVEATRP